MRIIFLVLLGIISVLYGFLILQIGSGTSFWMIWEIIGVCFLIWAFLVHKDFFASHTVIKWIFHILVIAGVVILSILCGLMLGKFNEKGDSDLDYVIVLGAQVREDGPSVVLKYRLDAAIEYLNENLDTICIVSGGQGYNEPCSEAESMADYLIENGIEESRVILEDKSKNTVENIRNSKLLIKQANAKVGIVTNNFHVFRAVKIAEKLGLENVCGIAAKSNTLYLPNNMLREYGGILKDWMAGNV